MGLFDSKRPKSALMRDRAYKSNEPHEQVYVRKTRPKNPRYMANGGGVGKGVLVRMKISDIDDFNDYMEETNNEYDYSFEDEDEGVIIVSKDISEQLENDGVATTLMGKMHGYADGGMAESIKNKVKKLTGDDLDTYKFFIREGDTEERAWQGVLDGRKDRKKHKSNEDFYRRAYEMKDGGSIEENKRMAVETFLGGLTNDELYYVANEYADLDWDDDANLDNQIQMWIKSLSNKDINMLHEELLGYKSGGKVDGRSTRAKNTWNSGGAWTRDRNAHNKSEDWEKPMNKRGGGSSKTKTTTKAPSKSSTASTTPSKTGKSKYSYIPNAMLREAEVENKGKTTYIDGADILDGIYVKKGTKYANGGGLDLFVTPKGRNVEYKGKSGGTYKYKWVDMPSEYSKVISGNGQFKNKINPIVADEMIDSMITNYNKFKDEKYAEGGGVDEIGMFHNGVFYKLGYSEEDNFYIKDFQEDILKGVKEVGFDTEREARDYAEELIDSKYSKFPNDDEDNYKDGGRVKKYNYVPNRMIQAIEVERNGKTTEIDGANILDGIYVKGKVKFADGGMADGGEVKSMKEMMDSCYTYGGLDKGSYNYERYILPYKGRLGEKMFDKVYNQYSDLLKSDYEVEGNTYTDSEGLTYNTLKKKYANGGMMDYGSDLTDESTVRGNITNGEIHCDTLTEIIGCEPNYPCHNVGSLKLTKCFLRPYYKIG